MDNKQRRFISTPLLFAVLSIATMAAWADIVIVGSLNSPELSKRKAKLIFLKKVQSFDNGNPVTPVDLSDDNPLKWRFYKALVNKRPAQIHSYWSRALFTGVGEPPEIMPSSQALRLRIQSDDSVVGYMDADKVSAGMKILLRLED